MCRLLTSFITIPLIISSGCVSKQRYAELLRETQQREKQQIKLEKQLSDIRLRNQALRDSIDLIHER